MKRTTLVWDGAVRLFHILFAAGFLSAFYIAKVMGEHAAAFPYHMMIGLSLALAVILRVLWLLVGTRWAKLSGLSLNPMDLVRYPASVFSPSKETVAGHNPATSWTMLFMFLLTLILAYTGLMKIQGNESFEKVHELSSYAFLALALLHIAGVILQMVVKKDALALSMVDGRKAVPESEGIQRGAPVATAAFAVIVGWFFVSLASSYQPGTGAAKWPITGASLQLGENEGGDGGQEAGVSESEGHDDGDD